MVRRLLLLALVLPLLQAAPASGHASVLPSASFEDQDGRQLDLAAMRGRVVVIVYGGRSALAQHVAWASGSTATCASAACIDRTSLRRPGRCRSWRSPMGGIPEAFRSMLRAMLRARVESGYSLWLDWDDRMSLLFGAHESVSTVVVADQQGVVRARVVSGPPQGEPYRAVSALLRHLR